MTVIIEFVLVWPNWFQTTVGVRQIWFPGMQSKKVTEAYSDNGKQHIYLVKYEGYLLEDMVIQVVTKQND